MAWAGRATSITPAFRFQLACMAGRGHFRCGELVQPGMVRGTEGAQNRPHLPILAPSLGCPLLHTWESTTEEGLGNSILSLA